MTAQSFFTSTTLSRIARAALVLLGLAALWMARQPLRDMLGLIRDRQAMIAYVQQYGAWGPILLGTMIVLQTVISFIPGHVLLITAGYLFGFTRGFLFSFACILAASQLAFRVTRSAARPVIYRLASRALLERWQKIADRQGFGFYLFAYIMPGFPSDFLSYVGGLSSIRPLPFLLANLLGRLPCVVLFVLIGSHGLSLPPLAWVALAVLTVVLFLVWRVYSSKWEAQMIGGIQ